jgi:hypothetical protein
MIRKRLSFPNCLCLDLFDANAPAFYFVPEGNTRLFTDRRQASPSIRSRPQEQALAFMVELLGTAVPDFTWDPTVQLSLLLDTSEPTPPPAVTTGSSPSGSSGASSTESAALTIGAIVGIIVAIVAVAGLVSMTFCLFSPPTLSFPFLNVLSLLRLEYLLLYLLFEDVYLLSSERPMRLKSESKRWLKRTPLLSNHRRSLLPRASKPQMPHSRLVRKNLKDGQLQSQRLRSATPWCKLARGFYSPYRGSGNPIDSSIKLSYLRISQVALTPQTQWPRSTSNSWRSVGLCGCHCSDSLGNQAFWKSIKLFT